MPYFTTPDGVQLHYKDWGQGRPVLLLHGWLQSADSWDEVAMALADNGFRTLSVDRRGHGRSEQPWTGYDYSTLSDDLAVKGASQTDDTFDDAHVVLVFQHGM